MRSSGNGSQKMASNAASVLPGNHVRKRPRKLFAPILNPPFAKSIWMGRSARSCELEGSKIKSCRDISGFSRSDPSKFRLSQTICLTWEISDASVPVLGLSVVTEQNFHFHESSWNPALLECDIAHVLYSVCEGMYIIVPRAARPWIYW